MRRTFWVWVWPAAVIASWVVVAALTITDLATVRPSLVSIDAPRSASAASDLAPRFVIPAG